MASDIEAIDRAAERLEAAKRTEQLAREARVRSEEELIALVASKPEGSLTTKTAAWRVTVTGTVNRTIDQPALAAIKDTVPPALFEQAIRYKPEVVPAGIKYLQANEPAVYAVLAQAITAKPGKAAVVVERIEQVEKAA